MIKNLREVRKLVMQVHERRVYQAAGLHMQMFLVTFLAMSSRNSEQKNKQ